MCSASAPPTVPAAPLLHASVSLFQALQGPHLRPSDGGLGVPTHLPGGGLASEELVVEGAVGRAEAGLQEDTAVGNGLQGGGALVGEAEPYEELKSEVARPSGKARTTRGPGKQGRGWGWDVHSQEAMGVGTGRGWWGLESPAQQVWLRG